MPGSPVRKHLSKLSPKCTSAFPDGIAQWVELLIGVGNNRSNRAASWTATIHFWKGQANITTTDDHRAPWLSRNSGCAPINPEKEFVRQLLTPFNPRSHDIHCLTRANGWGETIWTNPWVPLPELPCPAFPKEKGHNSFANKTNTNYK